jgi:hypothetical protein
MEGCQEEKSIRPDSPALALSPGDAKPGHRRIAGRQPGEAPGEYSVSIIARMAACQGGEREEATQAYATSGLAVDAV